MKKITSSLMKCLGALLAFFMTSSAQAQVASATDLYGTYEFTATMEITADGEEYKNLFSDKCDVKIEAHSLYDFNIVGLGGSTNTDGQGANYSAGNIEVISFNGTSYYYWGSPVILGSADGASPYDGSGWGLTYTVDANTKDITLQDFTAITVDGAWNTDKILAKFTNCKLTFKEAEIIELNDISGDYHFKAGTGEYDVNYESSFPTEFDMNVTATSVNFNAYKVTINYGEGYTPVELDATYDGINLIINFNEAYLNEEKTYAFASYYDASSLTSTIEFKYVSDKALSLASGICISKAVENEGVTTFELEQYYMSGVASKPSEDTSSFVGTYVVTCDGVYKFFEDAEGNNTDEYAYEYPSTFEIEIFQSEQNGNYYVGTFMNGNIFDNTWGYYPCEVDGNTLKLPVGDAIYVNEIFKSDDYTLIVDDVLYNGLGENTGTIDLTLNEDGTVSLGDFFLMRKTTNYDADWNPTSTVERAAYYGYLKIERKQEEVVEPYDFTGTYWMSADVETYVSDFTYPSVDFKMKIEEVFDVDGNSAGFFVKDFVHGNIYNSTYGAYPCVIEGNVLKIAVGDDVKTKAVSFSDDWLTTVYDILYTGAGENTGYITLTANEDGTFSMDDFCFYRLTQTWDAEYTNKTVTIGDKSASYSNIKVQKEGDAIEDVETAKPAVKVYVENGTIYVAGEAAVSVYNLSGVRVFNGVTNQVSGLANGLYIVKCGDTVVKVSL